MVSGLTASKMGAVGLQHLRMSADPDFEVDARFPCFPMARSDEQMIEAVVLTLNVL